MSAGVHRVGNAGGVPFFNGNRGVRTTDLASGIASITTAGTYDSGIQMCEAIGYSKIGVQLIGNPSDGAGGSGVSATIYGTFDPAAYALWKAGQGRGDTTLPASSWCILPANAEQTGTALSTNPIVNTGIFFVSTLVPIVAVRIVIDTTAMTTGSVQAVVFAVA